MAGTANQGPLVRVWGNPFRVEAAPLRGFLDRARSIGADCSLCLTGLPTEGGLRAEGERILEWDSVQGVCARTAVPDAELASARWAASRAVPATAPVLVFGSSDDVATAALEWPMARVVLYAAEASPEELWRDVESVQRERDDAPTHCLPTFELERLQAMRPPVSNAPLLYVASEESVFGSDLIAGLGRSDWLAVAPGDVSAETLERCRGVVLPWRGLADTGVLLSALASGRPVAAPVTAATARIVSRPGLVRPIGGRDLGAGFEPDPESLAHAVAALDEPDARATVERARAHVRTHHSWRPRPLNIVPRPEGARPSVVLEAPVFETSSAAELTIETAKALVARNRVDLGIVVREPFRHGVAEFREREPQLEPFLTRRPSRPDLWLSAGWPARAERPECGQHVVRFDWEYGAVPMEHAATLDQADRILVHSTAVRRAVLSTGLEPGSVAIVPHGVSAEDMTAVGEGDRRVLEFKRSRVALLFVGGLVWRKGFDLFIRVLLQLHREGLPVCGVVKAMGSQTHYAGYHLGDLLAKVQASPHAPDLLLIEDDLSRSELAGVYRGADLLVHPYRGEGFGMPTLEALACGLPVVVSDGGASDDFCREATAAVRVPADQRYIDLPGAHVGQPWVLEPDPEALVACVREAVLTNSNLRRSAQTDALRVQAANSWERTAMAIEEMALAARDARGSAPKVDGADTLSVLAKSET